MKKSISAVFTPISRSNIRLIKSRNKSNNKLFMTISDDLGFVNKQIEQLDNIYKKDKEYNQKLWKKQITNNIYKLDGKTNYQILKEHTQRFKTRKSINLRKLDLSKQPNLNNKQVEQILDANKISKRVLDKVDISKKVRARKIYLNEFRYHTRNISWNNLKMKLMIDERNNLSKLGKEYENALKYEQKSLDIDIGKFDTYMKEAKRKIKAEEFVLIKLMRKMRLLYEENKRETREYKYNVEEIVSYIKLIIKYKKYANFVQTLLGENFKNEDINLDEYINYRNWTETDLNKFIQKALNELSIYMKDVSLDEKILENLTKKNSLILLFKNMEDNILKEFEEKTEHEEEHKKIMKENEKNYNKLLKDYENLKEKYDIFFAELEEEKKQYNNLIIAPDLFDYYTEMTYLLEDFSNFLNDIDNNENLKNDVNQTNSSNEITENDSEFYLTREARICFDLLRKKETYIEELINEIERYKKEDPKLLKIIINERNLTHMRKRREKEKARSLVLELLKKEKFIKKFKQNILRQKYKFREPIPHYILQERKKHIVKYKPVPTSTQLLFY